MKTPIATKDFTFGDVVKRRTHRNLKIEDTKNVSAEPSEILEDGTRIFKNEEGQIHRDGHKPAIIHPNGKKEYYQNGKLHRDDGYPAVTETDEPPLFYIKGVQQEDNKLPKKVAAK